MSACEWGGGQKVRKSKESQADSMQSMEPYMGLCLRTLRM